MAASALKSVTEGDFDDVAALTQLYKALADGLRLEILRLLRTESFGVLEICRIFDIRQSGLSHHLKILATAGLVSSRREGNSIFYRRALVGSNERFHAVKEGAFAAIDQLPLREHIEQGIRLIQQERSEQSLDFFTRHAERFREKQGLIVERSQYEDSLLDLLDSMDLAPSLRVLEVGPGSGQLLSHLARRFDELLALDNSQDMLNQARATIAGQQMDNVRFVLGETRHAVEQGIRCDLLIYDMVLHHIASPWEAFQDCAKILADNGILLLIDLSRHDQDWVRESCGDLWLGFENNDLDAWADQAGLRAGQSLYLGLRNGFQIQIRLFHKPLTSTNDH